MYLVELPFANGHEQAGTRPAVIVAELGLNIAVIIPLTSNLQALQFPYTIEINPSKNNGLKTVSIALVFHIRAIDKKRIKSKIGDLEEAKIIEVNQMMKKLLVL